MSTSSIVLWLAEAPWAYALAGRWTALLVLAWVAHLVIAKRDPRWRVLVWRSAAVGLVTIVSLTAAPPFVAWRVPYAESIVVPVASSERVTPVADPLSVLKESPAQVSRLQTATAGLPRRSESAKRSSGGPAVAPRNGTMTGPSLGSGLLAIWLVGVAVRTLRLGLCVGRVSRIVRRSREVPDRVIEECRAVAAALGCGRAVRVVQTAEVLAPCLAGLFRPWLLLPEANCEEANRADLRAILAHELAHARCHDLVWNAVLHFWSIVLWFHPLVWRIRAAHLAACDAVCDALAADLVGDVASYGRTLARLALQVAGPARVPGLAMARTPDVLLRIEALQRRVFRGALPKRRIVPALLALGAVVILIGGSGITDSDQPPARKTTEAELRALNAAPDNDATQPAARHRLSLRVLNAKTGEPLDGVSVSWTFGVEGKPREETITTGKEGTATIESPAGINVHALILNVKRPGYVGRFYVWNDRYHAIALPESQEARLELGVPIRGMVQDEAGKPIAQASVAANAPATEGDTFYELGTTQTDEQGRWQIDEVPANLSRVSLHVAHPDYRRADAGAGESADARAGGRECRTILSKGATVTGRVLDGSGRPVPGAKVYVGADAFWSRDEPVATDERGAYTVRNCDARSTVVTAQAEGFAPELREVTVPTRGEVQVPVIQLGKASTLRVRVVDRAGKPVTGAYVAADTWRGHRSIRVRINTDAAGRIIWTSAPSDAVLFDISRVGYMRRELPLTASDQEQVVTLDPDFVISGSVTDAVTGKPVPRFRVIRGSDKRPRRESIGVRRWNEAEYTGGRYSIKFVFPSEALYVRVEAPGYEPAESRAFRPVEGAMIQDFRLKPGAWTSGVVLLPDGSPAEAVQVQLGTRENRASVRGGIVPLNSSAEATTTGPDGRFTFPGRTDPFALVVAANAGFADATSDEFAKTEKLVLQPWGRIEGEVRIGGKLAAHQSLSYSPASPEWPSKRDDPDPMRIYNDQCATDSQGRFAIDRVIPRRGHISPIQVTPLGNGGQQTERWWREPVEVKPGQTTQVRLGGKGRPVIGRVVLGGTPTEPVDWRTNEAAVLETPRAELRKATTPWRKFASGFDADGRFRIEDVALGTYELTIPVSLPSDRRTSGPPRARVGETNLLVTVPEGPADQPVDLGDVKAKLYPRVGDLAPEFTAPRLDGGQFTLSEQRGKLVLLHFWAAWCPPWRAEIPAIKDIHQTFGADPRFVLVGLSCDLRTEEPAEYARALAMSWTQVFPGKIRARPGAGHSIPVQELLDGVAATYHVQDVPAMILIGPNGRILAMNLRGAALKEAVRHALSDQKRFSGAK